MIECKGLRVAVVGNATAAFEYEYGPEIDGNDLVVRINAGVPEPQSIESIGTRTDVIVLIGCATWRKGAGNVPEMTKLVRAYYEVNARYGHVQPRWHLWTQPDAKFAAEYDRVFAGIDTTFVGTDQHDGLVETLSAMTSDNTRPSTGLSALAYFIEAKEQLGWSVLNVYGWDFWITPDWTAPGREPDGAMIQPDRSVTEPHSGVAEEAWFLSQTRKDPDIRWRR